nr:hypothetical protein [bacterium]
MFSPQIYNMNTNINQYKTIEEKLRMYREPFIYVEFLKKLRDKYAHGYTIPNLVSRKLITPIKR